MIKLINKEVSLILAEKDDADFILSLRLNPELNKYLSQTSTDLEMQKQWLLNYKKREALKTEFYFIINLRGEKVGTIRIYNIDYQKKTCTWGSFIIKRGVSKKPGNPRVSVISLFLIFNFIFSELSIETVNFDVRKENINIRKFYLSFAKITAEDEIDTFFSFSKEDYNKTFLTTFNIFLT